MSDAAPPPDPFADDHALWRDPAEVTAFRALGGHPDAGRFDWREEGRFWQTLEENNLLLLVTREYEHAVIALACRNGTPEVSYLPLPHPSGLAMDRENNRVFAACTRNPNQIMELRPAGEPLERSDIPAGNAERPLVPTRSWFFPGCMYFHDLALIGGELHANAVGHNAIAKINLDGGYARVWHPKIIDEIGRAHV